MAAPQSKNRLDGQPDPLSEERYDQSTFTGRVRKFSEIMDPRTLLPGLFFSMPIEKATGILSEYKSDPRKAISAYDMETLWTAKKVYQSQIHPDTGKSIPPPFRMAGFAPFGMPIVVGMLAAGSSPFQNIFWQWMNQTHNACVNYSNRNATAKTTETDMLLSYGAAVSAAMTISVAATKTVARFKGAPVISRFVPFMAVAAANIVNIGMMRRAELVQGISVYDPETKESIGSSIITARKALLETTISRVVLPIPILVGTPIIMLGIEKQIPSIKGSPRVGIALQAVIATSMFLFGLPISLALFEQEGQIDSSRLESELAEKVPPGTLLNYNKGL